MSGNLQIFVLKFKNDYAVAVQSGVQQTTWYQSCWLVRTVHLHTRSTNKRSWIMQIIRSACSRRGYAAWWTRKRCELHKKALNESPLLHSLICSWLADSGRRASCRFAVKQGRSSFHRQTAGKWRDMRMVLVLVAWYWWESRGGATILTKKVPYALRIISHLYAWIVCKKQKYWDPPQII